MTMVAPAALPARVSLARLAAPAAIAGLIALFAICHPYAGIRGDATIYVMRALADLDPAGLGRDMMVALDGQMRFSLFPLLLRPLVAALGAAPAAMLVAGLGSAAWLAALAALAQRLAPGRTGWAMAAMVAVLPVGYGGYGLFAFAETAATPRPLAEAAVLAGLAALLAGRAGLAVAALALSALLHPIMALPGVAVAALAGVWRLPARARLTLAAAAATASLAAVLAATLGVPLLDRLAIRPDAAWLDLLHLHSPHLFPTRWSAEAFAPIIAQAATLAVAAHRAPPRPRALYLAVLSVGGLGLAGAVILADNAHLLLALQAQFWRALWLVAVLGGCALAFCTASLWRETRGRLVLVLLALAWLFPATPVLSLAVAGLALVLEFGDLGARLPLADRHVAALGGVVGICAIWWASGPALGYVEYLRTLPTDAPRSLIDPLRNNLHTLPLLALVAWWLVAPPERFANAAVAAVLACAAVVLAMLAVQVWDQRGAAQAYLEVPREPPGLAALAAGRAPEVLWLDDEADAWLALRRPQYFSPQQGVSMVFSRPLAMEWARRADELVGLGLGRRHVFTPWRAAADDDRPRVTQAAVDALCAKPEAPGLLILPHEMDAGLRAGVIWPLPAPLFRVERYATDDARVRVDGFAIVPCGAGLLR